MVMNSLNTLPHFMYMYVWGVSLVTPPLPPPPALHPTHTLINEPMKTYDSQRERENFFYFLNEANKKTEEGYLKTKQLRFKKKKKKKRKKQQHPIPPLPPLSTKEKRGKTDPKIIKVKNNSNNNTTTTKEKKKRSRRKSSPLCFIKLIIIELL